MTDINQINPKALRHSLGLNQTHFWGRIGVEQSAGSRYESGRRMPKPVMELLRLTYIERIDLSRINAADLELLDYIKTSRPDVLANVKAILAQSGGMPVETRMEPAAHQPLRSEPAGSYAAA